MTQIYSELTGWFGCFRFRRERRAYSSRIHHTHRRRNIDRELTKFGNEVTSRHLIDACSKASIIFNPWNGSRPIATINISDFSVDLDIWKGG
jgi:hypothetical protein